MPGNSRQTNEQTPLLATSRPKWRRWYGSITCLLVVCGVYGLVEFWNGPKRAPTTLQRQHLVPELHDAPMTVTSDLEAAEFTPPLAPDGQHQQTTPSPRHLWHRHRHHHFHSHDPSRKPTKRLDPTNPQDFARKKQIVCAAATTARSSSNRNASSRMLLVSGHNGQTNESTMPTTGFVDYEYLVYCTAVGESLAVARLTLVAIVFVLLFLLSSTADSFFCPSLQAIVEELRVPPDIAGVTFLSFGNGSPDVFANIAAFASSTPRIGIMSIIGGGLLVTTVIAASVGLASQGQEQLVPRKFVRDVGFYLIAVTYFYGMVCIESVNLACALGFLVIYLAFVTVVFVDKYIVQMFRCKLLEEQEPFTLVKSEPTWFPYYHSSSSDEYDELSLLAIAHGNVYREDASDVFQIGAHDQQYLSHDLSAPTLSRKRSAPTPTTGLGFDEGSGGGKSRSLLERTDSLLKRPASLCTPSAHRRRRQNSTWDSIEQNSHFGSTARKWTRSFKLQGIQESPPSSVAAATIVEDDQEDDAPKQVVRVEDLQPSSTCQRLFRGLRWMLHTCVDVVMRFIWEPFEAVCTFARKLCIPLVDEDTWDKRFACVCPFFSILIMGLTVFDASIASPWFLTSLALGGTAGGLFVAHTSRFDKPPQGQFLIPFLALAFVMSVIWIMNIADELLAVLETLGELMGISEAVLGVSVLSWGNSIGDLVSDVSIARDGFPVMAFAGCFAGPMFNLLVGVGASLTIATLKHGGGAFSMGKPSLLVHIGFVFLLSSLVLNLVLAIHNQFEYRVAHSIVMYLLYATFAVVAVCLAFGDGDVEDP